MKLILTFIACTMIFTIASVTLTVDMAGSGDFTHIQAAIDASASGDTILVYPGRYYENINYSGKSICIASLELSTGNPAYRDSTIIDGNNNGSCVMAVSYENNASIYGFTICHGSGYSFMQNGAMISKGGGFRLKYTNNFQINNCIITDNSASVGGGIQINQGTMNLKDTIITNNSASYSAGGISFESDSNCTFDSVNRCSIYENYAGDMNDIGASEVGGVINIVLDTFTVNPPTAYYSNYVYLFSGGAGYFTYDILNAHRTEVNHDLYVSPGGSDDNDGLSPANPLKSIAKALHTIASDSLNPKTVYLAPGTYSSADGQLFPLSMKASVKLVGDSLSYPIIENLHYQQTLAGGYAPELTVKNMIFEHGSYQPHTVFFMSHCDNSQFSNITINPVHAVSYAGMFMYQGNYDLENITLRGLTSNCMSGFSFFVASGSAKNLTIDDCHTIGGEDLPLSDLVSATLHDTLILENITIINSSVLSPESSIIKISSSQGQNPQIRLANLLVANNTSTSNSPVYIKMNSIHRSALSNCSFVNNVGGSSILKLSGKIDISNCLISNGSYSEINIRNTQAAGYTSSMTFQNNLISGYPNSVYYHTSNQVTFNDVNFSAEPSFLGQDWTDPMAYRLNFDSPCIDAGTPDTDGLFLPQTDLYGNPRIYNDIVDIGAHEYSGTGNHNAVNPTLYDNVMLSSHPNPFRSHCTINYFLKTAAETELAVFNLRGQRIRTLQKSMQDKGEHSLDWDGTNNSGQRCGSGIYIAKLKLKDRNVASRKIYLIK
ncbi:MAG TPA: DUF1565 domain-containing protein [Candidatus Cloacimonadota bacterium]|jgi:hypothetical protein|nr:DUF1565 domain-containing protein [Candidatus Cloacimonadota bacterium]HOG30573.1 DUF1565 domain-containing protein [Candidatus Cloacimonadota bacterium]HOR58847.1 DUF1565 domain-containing protein [Candidatus Cloacimonadota bacterium]HPB08311.1 DUF1565 domain-containing protein [Candidatus Cloacimonadota bacterium]HPL23572.1 DUF1565 domain-containing protein [Candidatus Cloacimonadota bacterium]